MPLLLLVEDGEEMRMLVEVSLEDWEIVEATSSQQALELLGQHRPDLIMVDSMLDDGPAEGALPALRTACPTAPILWFATKLPSPEFKEFIAGQVSKPFMPDELPGQLARFLPAGA